MTRVGGASVRGGKKKRRQLVRREGEGNDVDAQSSPSVVVFVLCVRARGCWAGVEPSPEEAIRNVRLPAGS